MPLFKRPDGVPVRRVSTLRRFMPYLMRGRNESAVYFIQRLDVGPLLRWLDERDTGRDVEAVSFFSVVLASIVRALALRPELNRYVVGRRLYQRTDIALSFAVKKSMRDDAGLTTVKVRFQPEDTLPVVVDRVARAVEAGRAKERTPSEKEMSVVTAMPGPLLALVMWAQRLLDGWNLLPDAMIDNDPLYASVFIANLGSVGLEAPFHHLYEYGTVPLFGVIGRIHKAQWVDDEGEVTIRDTVEIRWTYDERIQDGFYCAGTLDLMREMLADPSKLERPPELPNPGA